MRTINADLIRKLAVQKQRLTGPRPQPTVESLKDILRSIRCLQIDPIRAVERTQHLVLFSRLGPHDTEILSTAAYEERFLFEYWAHAASYVLTEDYPIHNYKMRNVKQSDGAWAKRVRNWLEDNQAYKNYILETLDTHGAKLVSEFEDQTEKSWHSSGWSSGRNAPVMISHLWDRGVIGVAHRDGLKKYWDLAERVLPEWTPRNTLTAYETTYQAAQFAIKALGVGTVKQIKNHFTRNRYPDLTSVLGDLEREGKIQQVELEDCPEAWGKQGPWYIHSDDESLLDSLENGNWRPRTVLLSPFDNLIADRDRTELLWNFHYRIEIYVPAKKRQYGYYVLPILHGDQIIGRIDPKMDRKKGVLSIQNVYKENNNNLSTAEISVIRTAIEELAEFLGAREIQYSKNIPDDWKGLTSS